MLFQYLRGAQTANRGWVPRGEGTFVWSRPRRNINCFASGVSSVFPERVQKGELAPEEFKTMMRANLAIMEIAKKGVAGKRKGGW